MVEKSSHAGVELHLDEALLSGVLRSLIRVLAAAGVPHERMSKALQSLALEAGSVGRASELVSLGSMQRDCMEVMCLWRRDQRFVDDQGLPSPLTINDGVNRTGFSGDCFV